MKNPFLYLLNNSRGVREPEISSQVGNTKFFRDKDGYPKISRFSKEPEFSKESRVPKELRFGKGLQI